MLGAGSAGAVAVMDIEVDDRNTLETHPFHRIGRCNRNVVEQAETHRTPGGCVVTARSDGTERI